MTKKIFKVVVVAGLLMFTSFAKAQTKIGYINFQQVISLMPDTKTINAQIQTYQKQFVDQLTAMNNELQTKGQDYQKNSATMTDAIRSAKQAELQDFQKRMQDYQDDARQKVEAKSNELSKPLIDKARAAITDVAKEKGYAYVLDSSQQIMVVLPPGDDMLEPVKAKLGLK